MHTDFFLFPSFPNSTVIHLFIGCLLLFLISQAREHGQHGIDLLMVLVPIFLISQAKIVAEEGLLSPELWHHAMVAALWSTWLGPCGTTTDRVSAEDSFCDFSHQAPTDKGKPHILEFCVCTKYGHVFTKAAKRIFLWK